MSFRFTTEKMNSQTTPTRTEVKKLLQIGGGGRCRR